MMNYMKKLILVFIFALVCTACRKDESEVYYEDSEQDVKSDTTGMPASEGALTWDKPMGFKETPLGGFRKGSYTRSSDAGEVQFAISSFPGSVGGTRANINRWRGQLNLEPMTEGDSLPSESLGQFSFVVIEIDSPEGQSILAAILEQKKETWFFKMMGSSGAVKEQKESFLSLLKSVRPGRGGKVLSSVGGTKSGMTSPENQKPSFSVPAGWEEIPSTNSMRLISLRPQGEFSKMGEIGVITLSSVSSEKDLLKMWSRTLQLPEDNPETPFQEVTINGNVWKVFEDRSQNAIWADKQHARLIVAFHKSTSGKAWFVKGFGEDLFMVQEKKKILSLIESIKFQTVEAK